MTVAFIIKINLPGDDIQSLTDTASDLTEVASAHFDVVSVEPWARAQSFPLAQQQNNTKPTAT